MARPVSLTFRLTLMFSVVATVVFLSFGWFIGNSIEVHFASEDTKELEVIAKAVSQSLAELDINDDIEQVKQRFDDILIGHHSALLRVTDANGATIYNSPTVDLSSASTLLPLKINKHDFLHWQSGKNNYRILKRRVVAKSQQNYLVIIAVAIDFHANFLSSFRHNLWIMVLAGIAIMGFMGWLAVRHGHRPLHHIVDHISHINADELNTRLSPELVPSELTEIAISFNELLQRMEEAFNRLSNFSADIAHELRTPVTNLMTQTQVALSQARNATEYEEILYSNIEEYERMAQMIGDMLFIAKADDSLHPLNTENIRLQDEVSNLFEYYEAWAEELEIKLVLTGKANIKADRLMLQRALNNLISNAIRHTPKNQTVSVVLEQSQNMINISIENPGIPIPAQHLNKIFHRFYRVDPSRQRGVEGAGLGLAIVKSIIDAHHGKIEATSNEIKTVFYISIPDHRG